MGILASISIGINPNLFHLGAFTLSWHGVMTFVAVAVAVYLVARWGGKEGMIVDSIYSVAVWAIIGGFIGGALYIMIRNSEWFLTMWRTVFPFMGEAHRANLPGIGRLADIAAPAVLFAQAIGRIGDVINGEHLAKITELPWGIIYTHPDSPAYLNAPVHPAVGYELIFDLVLLAALWPLRDRLRPNGMFFTLYLATYSIGRFFLSFLRVEFNQYFGALNEAQVVAIIVVIFTVPLLVWKAQLVRPTARRT